MSDEHHGATLLLLQTNNELENRMSVLAIEITGRFIRKEQRWPIGETPRDGDAVFLSRMKDPTHVGIWIASLKATLHCAVGGSVLHDTRHLAIAQWRVRGYFTPEA